MVDNRISSSRGAGVVITGKANTLIGNEILDNREAGVVLASGVKGNMVCRNEIQGNAGTGIAVDARAAGNSIVADELKGNNLDIKAQPPANTGNLLAGNLGS